MDVFRVFMQHGAKPWVADVEHPHFRAGRRAIKTGKSSALAKITAFYKWSLASVIVFVPSKRQKHTIKQV